MILIVVCCCRFRILIVWLVSCSLLGVNVSLVLVLVNSGLLSFLCSVVMCMEILVLERLSFVVVVCIEFR